MAPGLQVLLLELILKKLYRKLYRNVLGDQKSPQCWGVLILTERVHWIFSGHFWVDTFDLKIWMLLLKAMWSWKYWALEKSRILIYLLKSLGTEKPSRLIVEDFPRLFLEYPLTCRYRLRGIFTDFSKSFGQPSREELNTNRPLFHRNKAFFSLTIMGHL